MNILFHICIIWASIVGAYNLLWAFAFGNEYLEIIMEGPEGDRTWYLLMGYNLSGVVSAVYLLIVSKSL